MTKAEFKLGDTKFYEYHSGPDSRGVRSHTYMVDDRAVNYDAYWATLAQTLKNMGAYQSINNAMDFAKSCLYPLSHYIGKQ